MEKQKRKFPHTYVIIFSLIAISAVLTWLVPGGAFERETVVVNGFARSVVVAESYHAVPRAGQSWQVFTSLFEGMLRTSDIIFYILTIGGAFWMLNESRALDVAIALFLRLSKRVEGVRAIRWLGVDNIIVTLIMLCFSFFGAVIGMSEETIAFVVIFVPMAVRMGYDSIVGISMCFLAAGLGFAGALLNPFTIGIAQGLAGVQLFSGLEYRLLVWAVINAFGIGYVLRPLGGGVPQHHDAGGTGGVPPTGIAHTSVCLGSFWAARAAALGAAAECDPPAFHNCAASGGGDGVWLVYKGDCLALPGDGATVGGGVWKASQ